MMGILDTHVFLWWIADDPQLPDHIRSIISNSNNDLFLSAASCWEMTIKAQLGKLKLPDKPERYIPEQMAVNTVQGLPIQITHALHIYNPPCHHRDPFDRMIVAQSQVERLPIITSDPLIAKYKVRVIWDKD